MSQSVLKTKVLMSCYDNLDIGAYTHTASHIQTHRHTHTLHTYTHYRYNNEYYRELFIWVCGQ